MAFGPVVVCPPRICGPWQPFLLASAEPKQRRCVCCAARSIPPVRTFCGSGNPNNVLFSAGPERPCQQRGPPRAHQRAHAAPESPQGPQRQPRQGEESAAEIESADTATVTRYTWARLELRSQERAVKEWSVWWDRGERGPGSCGRRIPSNSAPSELWRRVQSERDPRDGPGILSTI